MRRHNPRGRVREDDVMQAARLGHGLENVDQVNVAIIVRNRRVRISSTE